MKKAVPALFLLQTKPSRRLLLHSLQTPSKGVLNFFDTFLLKENLKSKLIKCLCLKTQFRHDIFVNLKGIKCWMFVSIEPDIWDY